MILAVALALAGCESLSLPQAKTHASLNGGRAPTQLGASVPVEGEVGDVTVAGRYIAASGEECIRYQADGVPVLACREGNGSGFVAAGPDMTRPSAVQAVAPAAGAPDPGVAMMPHLPAPVAAEKSSALLPEAHAPVSQPLFPAPAPLLPDASAQSSGDEAQAPLAYTMAAAPSVLPRRKPSSMAAAPLFIPDSARSARAHPAPAVPRRRVLPPPGSVSWRDETVWEDAVMKAGIPGRETPSGGGLSLREEFLRGASARGTGAA